MTINYENISYYLVQTKGIMFIAQHCPSPADYPTYVLQYGPDPDCVTGLQHPDYVTKSPDHPDYVTAVPKCAVQMKLRPERIPHHHYTYLYNVQTIIIYAFALERESHYKVN